MLIYGLFWCIGFHWLFNFVETCLYTFTKTVPINKTMAGERKTPDDDGLTTTIVESVFIIYMIIGGNTTF